MHTLTSSDPVKTEGRHVMKHTIALVLAVSLLAGVSGCATSSGARLDRSKEVLDSFLAFDVLPGYRYYTLSPGNTPDAILGIKSGYTLKSEVWDETEMTSELLKRQVRQMNNLFSAEETGLIGASVLNDQGEQVGIWYSAVGITEVSMVSATEVAVNPPNRLAINQLKTKLR
jgi:hypothetical protein